MFFINDIFINDILFIEFSKSLFDFAKNIIFA